jgi:outer membrane protein
MGKRAAFLLGCGLWLLGTAAPAPAQPVLSYELDGAIEATADGPELTASPQQVEPGEQYPPTERDRSLSPTAAPPARSARKTEWSLRVDASAVADSNVANATDRETVEIDYGGVVLPVPLDPALREHGGIGFGASASAGVDVPVSRMVTFAADAEAYLLDHEGDRTDDASVLIALGPELRWSQATEAAVQLILFERWYGGETANRGVGVRGRLRQQVGDRRHVTLRIDGRVFESGYGEDFGGSQASAYLTYEAVLAPDLAASFGAYARREWLEGERFSSVDWGAFTGFNHFLDRTFAIGASGGVSRIEYDEPLLFLSPDPRRDWRLFGSAYIMTRRPVLWGLVPSLTYTYNRTSSSILFYRADRHRLRLGLSRSF